MRPSKAGEKCNLYKGGRHIDRKGYIHILARWHPFANSNGYVVEHRLVWEEHHKAILLPWINIHHENGNKKDNRIENLRAITQSKHSILHNPKDPEKAKAGRSRRKKRWWNKLYDDKERHAHSLEMRRANYWKNRDRELKRLYEYRKRKKG